MHLFTLCTIFKTLVIRITHLHSSQSDLQLGGDHALEHIMKVTGGFVGTTQNASARERFFLTTLELNRLAEEAHQMAGSPTAARKVHHDQSMAVWTRQEENVLRLKDVIRSS